MMTLESDPCYHDMTMPTITTTTTTQQSSSSEVKAVSHTSGDIALNPLNHRGSLLSRDVRNYNAMTHATSCTTFPPPPLQSVQQPANISAALGDRLVAVSSNNITRTTTATTDDNEINCHTTTIRHRQDYNNNNNPSCTNRTHPFTDEQLLILAFLSFFSFAIVQMIFAVYVAHSHAMIGDSSVMLLDALTYLFNGYSERRKRHHYDTQYELLQIIQSSPPSPVQQSIQSTTTNENQNDHNIRGISKDTVVDVEDPNTDNDSPELQQQQQQQHVLLALQLRQKVKFLEIVAPSISVLALIVVTVVVTQQAIRTIQSIVSSTRQNRHAAEEPNLYIILFFSIFNLLLDGINMYFFTRPNNVSICSKLSCSCCRQFQKPPSLMMNVTEDDMTDQDVTDFDDRNDNDDRDSIAMQNRLSQQQETNASTPAMSGVDGLLLLQDESFQHKLTKEHHNHHSHSSATTTAARTTTTNTVPTTNMNMCSAYTHVLADTLRSIAVITAVLLALYNDIEPALADATAALIVSFLIALSLIPLIQGLYSNVYELYYVRLQLQQYNQQES